ncbi:MAG: heme ABC exporter ATP-binding protein CcmA [Pseudomonadota bacterium]
MIAVTGLILSRGERVLFRDLSFAVAPGEAVALTGANGAGKTSLLRAIAGFIRPDAGAVTFGDQEPGEARARSLHLLGHLDGLKGGRTARAELAFQADWLGAEAGGVERAVQALALKPLLDLEVRKLSAGQRRRVALARLLAAPRPIWLLDEPLSPLDARWRVAVGGLMQAHLDGGGSIIAAVHDPLPITSRPLDLGGVA